MKCGPTHLAYYQIVVSFERLKAHKARIEDDAAEEEKEDVSGAIVV